MISSLLMLTLLVMRYYGSSESVIPEGFARLMHGGRDGKPLSVDEFLAEKVWMEAESSECGFRSCSSDTMPH